MEKLIYELEKNHKNNDLTHYVKQTLKQLRKSDGVAFTGILQQFFNTGPVIKNSSSVQFNQVEKDCWTKIFSYQQLGNNLFIL